MVHILHREDQRKGAIAAVAFEGEPYGSEVSFFLGDLLPGNGPGLHSHHYSETCIVRQGQAAMCVDGEEVTAAAGDIVVIGPETPCLLIGLDRLGIESELPLTVPELEVGDCMIGVTLNHLREKNQGLFVVFHEKITHSHRVKLCDLVSQFLHSTLIPFREGPAILRLQPSNSFPWNRKIQVLP